MPESIGVGLSVDEVVVRGDVGEGEGVPGAGPLVAAEVAGGEADEEGVQQLLAVTAVGTQEEDLTAR